MVQSNSLMKTMLASAVVVALMAGLMLGIHFLQAARENALFAGAHALPVPGEELSVEAEDIPLVVDLWNKARYYDATRYEVDDYGKPTAKHPFGELEEIHRGLSEASIVPQDVASHLGGNSSIVESQDVAQNFIRLGDALLHDGKVVNLWLATSKDAVESFDQGAACRSYVDYLGLDVLDDWQEARLFEPENRHSAALYSDSAQLLVQVTVDARGGADTVSVGVMVTPMGRQAFAGENLADGKKR